MPVMPDQDPYYRLRHSAAHVMAQAVLVVFPEVKIAIGPPITDGFYYDFDLPRPLTPDDLTEIEGRMRRIISGAHPFQRRVVSPQEARSLFKDQPYKLELIEDLLQGAGEYGEMQIAKARAEEQARNRDHRKLGKELDLFSTSEEVGPGLILWHPKGAMIRMLAEDFSRQAHLQNGYEWVFSPHIGRAHLWETSGHLDFYKENMYSPMDIEDEEYYVKPMNCPFHIQIFKSHPRSYRELPKRYAEYGTVYRFERSGVLHGLTRVRGFTQDDAHIFCRPDQVEEEISRALDFSLYVLRSFGLTDFKAYLSTQPEKYVGDPVDWDRATEALRGAINYHAIPYEEDMGGGAFYGPKIDLKVSDALGREWQLSTIQFDFNLPERFDLEYVGQDGQAHRPYMVHRALLGSMERFFGVLIEHYAGAFPVWLAPVQVVVIPISEERHSAYGREVSRKLQEAGVRVELDDSKERMQAKIRRAQMQKTPYMLVIGDREQSNQAVAIRLRSGEDLGALPVEAFIERIVGEVKAKK